MKENNIFFFFFVNKRYKSVINRHKVVCTVQLIKRLFREIYFWKKNEVRFWESYELLEYLKFKSLELTFGPNRFL